MTRLQPHRDPTQALYYKLRFRLKCRFGIRLLSRVKERLSGRLHDGIYIRLAYRLHAQPLTSKET